jgi:hypothetical protein
MTSRSRVKRFSKIVTALSAVAVSMAGLSLHPVAAQAATDVYVVAVGDIACDPSPKGDPNYYAAYNNGNGTPDGCRQLAVGAAVVAAKPDQFWPLGDNQYFDGKYAKYMEAYDKAFGAVKSITRPIPGNHEWKDLTLPTQPGAGYFTYFGAAAHPETNGTYSFDAGDWHVIAINDNVCDLTHPCGPGSALATWIASDIAANPKPCTVAMWHHPLWSLGEAHKGGYGPLVPVWNQLNGLGVDMVITGHDHNYVRTVALGNATVDPADPSKVLPPAIDPKGMVEFVIGTGGVDNYAASAATAQTFGAALAAWQVGKPSPGLFGAGGFHLKSDRYTFAYLPAANSAPFTDSAGRTCRRATNGNPQDVPGEPTVTTPTPTTLAPQNVSWTPANTNLRAASTTGGTIAPSESATSNGDGAISYAVTSAGSTGCSVDTAKGVIKYSDPGECEVTATAAATKKFAQGHLAIVFTISPGGPGKKQDMTSVQPASGPIAGGNTITLVGHGFADATKVLMDGTAAKFEVVSDTRMSVVVPPVTQSGPIGIRVTVGPPQGAIVAPTAYTYLAQPVASATPPAAGTVMPVSPVKYLAPVAKPGAARNLAPGMRLLSPAAASHVRSTVVKGRPASSMGAAPTARVKVGKPFSLLIGGQAAGQNVMVRASARGTTVAIGAPRVTAKAWLKVPALTVTRVGVVTLGIITPSSGKRSYVKVLVVK